MAIAALAALLAIASAAAGRKTHTYQVLISISVDRSAHLISGKVTSEPEAPSFFCEMASLRIREEMPGKDKVVARVYPNEERLAEWKFTVGPSLHGARLYAETSAYHLPSRPIECLAGRSRTVTAP
ncbi:MAG TPA: hypothetical protein VGI17_00755 [Solirubrobacterales bacterium]